MGRVLAIDYGKKRVGLALSDPLRMIASPLETVTPQELIPYITRLHSKETLEAIVLGMPKNLQGLDTDSTASARQLKEKLLATFPGLNVTEWDERFTSRMAHATMLQGGLSKKRRADKALVDRVSATIILQEYLDYLPG